MESSLPLGLLLAASLVTADPAYVGYKDKGAVSEPYAGSAPTILGPLAADWVAAFNEARNAKRIALSGPHGPPQGKLDPQLQAFLEGRLDFAFITREISERDLEVFRRIHGHDPLTITVAGGSWNLFGYVDPVVFIVHESNPLASLTFEQIDAIFSSTRFRGHDPIVEWGSVGLAGWRGKPIHLVGGDGWAMEESARALTVRRHILSVNGHRGSWRAAPDSGDEAQVVERVAADPLAIGFTGHGHIGPGVRILAVAEKQNAPARLPTRGAVLRGEYPLARPVQILVSQNAAGCVEQSLAEFVAFLVGAGGREVLDRQSIFLPLTRKQMATAQASLRAATCPGEEVRN